MLLPPVRQRTLLKNSRFVVSVKLVADKICSTTHEAMKRVFRIFLFLNHLLVLSSIAAAEPPMRQVVGKNAPDFARPQFN